MTPRVALAPAASEPVADAVRSAGGQIVDLDDAPDVLVSALQEGAIGGGGARRLRFGAAGSCSAPSISTPATDLGQASLSAWPGQYMVTS
jgi:hypothetical protein